MHELQIIPGRLLFERLRRDPVDDAAQFLFQIAKGGRKPFGRLGLELGLFVLGLFFEITAESLAEFPLDVSADYNLQVTAGAASTLEWANPQLLVY